MLSSGSLAFSVLVGFPPGFDEDGGFTFTFPPAGFPDLPPDFPGLFRSCCCSPTKNQVDHREFRSVVVCPVPLLAGHLRRGPRSEVQQAPLEVQSRSTRGPPPKSKGQHRPPTTKAHTLEPKWLSLSFFRQGNGVEDCSPTPRASAPPTVAGGHGGKRFCWQGS